MAPYDGEDGSYPITGSCLLLCSKPSFQLVTHNRDLWLYRPAPGTQCELLVPPRPPIESVANEPQLACLQDLFAVYYVGASGHGNLKAIARLEWTLGAPIPLNLLNLFGLGRTIEFPVASRPHRRYGTGLMASVYEAIDTLAQALGDGVRKIILDFAATKGVTIPAARNGKGRSCLLAGNDLITDHPSSPGPRTGRTNDIEANAPGSVSAEEAAILDKASRILGVPGGSDTLTLAANVARTAWDAAVNAGQPEEEVDRLNATARLADRELQLHVRKNTIELPSDGFEYRWQAQAVSRMSQTLRDIQSLQRKLGYKITKRDDTVIKADSLRSKFEYKPRRCEAPIKSQQHEEHLANS